MTKLLEQALAATDKLSPELQDEVARMILAFTGAGGPVYELSDEELAALDEAENSGFASDHEITSLWTKADR